MIEFEDRRIADDQQKLVDLLRAEAKRVVVEDYNPAADRGALDWVRRLLVSHPELSSRVQSAFETLLRESDPRVVNEILFQLEQSPDKAADILVPVVEKAHDSLQEQVDTVEASGRSLLGAVVSMIDRKRPTLSREAAEILAQIEKRGDGWPTSYLLALIADPKECLPRLNAVLSKLDADELSRFAGAMVVQGEPMTTDGFSEVRKSPIRDKFAAAVKAFIEESEETRQRLLGSGTLDKFPPEVRAKVQRERPLRWPEFAARLGVNP